MVDAPLKVVCGACGKAFDPEDRHYMPCPACGEILGHTVTSGKELYIDEIEGDTEIEADIPGDGDAAAKQGA